MRRGIKFMDDRKQYYANSGDRYRHNEIRREKENHYVPRHRENFRYERRESPHDEEIIEDVDEGILYFSDCTMFPPRNYRERNLKPKRKRPEGCKTICIDGLPVSLVRIPKRLERILLEVFSANGGSIESVHISGKGICYIRFDKEESIEHAMSLSGYHMEVKQSYESVVRFRVVIDYAESQEDIEELESKQLIANRLNLNDTKVPTVPFFNSAAVDSLIVDLKNPEAYYDSVIILRYWMTTNLNRHTSDRFFNLLQVSSNQIKRLQSEKNLLGEEYNTLMQRYWSNLSRLDKECKSYDDVSFVCDGLHDVLYHTSLLYCALK